MKRRRSVRTLLVVALLTVGAVAPVTASPLPESEVGTVASTTTDIAPPNESEKVGVGQQIATVVTAESESVQSAVEQTTLTASFDRIGTDETQRAELIAERAAELRERAAELREQYRETTVAYRAGEVDETEYARRIAVLNARARSLTDRLDTLRQRASTVSPLALRAAGLNRSTFQEVDERLDAVSGAGPRALLERFTGARGGSIDVAVTESGVSISVDGEEGQSREVDRAGDDDESLTVSQSTALSTAKAALSNVSGEWTLVSAGVESDEGRYTFRFEFAESDTTGEASVTIDGSSGTVVALEEEIRPVDDEDADGSDESDTDSGDENESDDSDTGDDQADDGSDDESSDDDASEAGGDEAGDLAVVVTRGTPAPGETVTLQVLGDGGPVSNVTVRLDGTAVGTTGPEGTLSVELPEDDVTLTATRGESEARLEFEFGDTENETAAQSSLPGLTVDPTRENGTVTIAVRYRDEGVANATVFVNGERVGVTGQNGTVTIDENVTIDAGDTVTVDASANVTAGAGSNASASGDVVGNATVTENESEDGESVVTITVVKGEFTADYHYVIVDGSFVPAEEADEAGDDSGPSTDGDDATDDTEESDDDDDDDDDDGDDDTDDDDDGDDDDDDGEG